MYGLGLSLPHATSASIDKALANWKLLHEPNTEELTPLSASSLIQTLSKETRRNISSHIPAHPTDMALWLKSEDKIMSKIQEAHVRKEYKEILDISLSTHPFPYKTCSLIYRSLSSQLVLHPVYA
jgi:hypothetical protein